jgi:hypothetical protein
MAFPISPVVSSDAAFQTKTPESSELLMQENARLKAEIFAIKSYVSDLRQMNAYCINELSAARELLNSLAHLPSTDYWVYSDRIKELHQELQNHQVPMPDPRTSFEQFSYSANMNAN